MSEKKLLQDYLGPSIAKALGKMIFKVPVISDPLIDFLSERLNGKDRAKQTELQISSLVDQCLAPLMPIFASATDFNPEAVAILLSETIERPVDVKGLIAGDLSHSRVREMVMQRRPLNELEKKAYGTADIAAYRRALPILLDKLIDIAPKLEGFEGASTAEILGRLTKLAEDAKAVRSGIKMLHTRIDEIAHRNGEEEQNYTIEYCKHIDKHLNAVQLFGITTEAVASQQQLSTAFIPLSLVNNQNKKEQTGSIYFSSLLERLTSNTPRLVITGPAGSGKTTLLKWAAIRAAETISINIGKSDEWASDDGPGSTVRDLSKTPMPAPEQSRKLGFAENAIPFRHDVERLGNVRPDGRWHEPQPRPLVDSWRLHVPFFIPLRYCADGRLPALDTYPKIGTGFALDPPPDWVQTIIKAGRALILIDGIDEIPESDRRQIKDALESFCRFDKGNYVVITTRPSVVDKSWFWNIPMMHAEVNPLMESERTELIKRWHEAAAEQLALIKRPDDASALAHVLTTKLRSAPHIAQLGTNPLLCAAICALHYNRKGYLPKDQADLCQELCQLLIHRRDEERGLVGEGREHDYGRLDYKQKEALIRDLAQTNLRAGGATLDPEDAKERIHNKLPALRLTGLNSKEIRNGLVKRTGLLREAYGGAIDFAHNTLRDFLAGKAFASDPGGYKELLHNINQETWHRPIVFAAGKGERHFCETLISALLSMSNRNAKILAMLTENAATEVDPKISTKVKSLYDQFLPPQSVEEARQLAALGDLVVDRLVHPDADEKVAHACAQALRLIGTKNAKKALRAYWATKHEEVAEELARTFGPLGIPFWQEWIQVQPLPETWANLATDASALGNLTDAEVLRLDNTGIRDVTTLARLSRLQTLDLNNTRVKDISPVAGLSELRTLVLNKTDVTDIGPLAELTCLQTLILNSTDVSDISPLAGLTGLQELYLDYSNVVDISPLAGLTGLEVLRLDHTTIKDLSALAGLNGLQRLYLTNSSVIDISVLSHIEGLQIIR